MCTSIVLPRFDSDKIDKGLIPKTFGVSAENLTLPREQAVLDICLLHSRPRSPALSHKMHIVGAQWTSAELPA